MQLVEAGDLEVEALDGRGAEAEVEVVADLVRRREVLVAQDAGRHAAVVAAVHRRTVEAGVGEGDTGQHIEVGVALLARARVEVDALDRPGTRSAQMRRAAVGMHPRSSASPSSSAMTRLLAIDVVPLEADAGQDVEVAGDCDVRLQERRDGVGIQRAVEDRHAVLVAVLQDLAHRGPGSCGWSCPGIRSGCRPGYPG